MAKKKESWKPIKGYENIYEVSDLGNVRRMAGRFVDSSGRNQNIKKTRTLQKLRATSFKNHNKPYLAIQLWKNNTMKRQLIHTLVAQAFIGKKPKGKEINHIDGNKLNNCVQNLEYVTRSENMIHGYKTGLYKKGGEHYFGKFNNSTIVQIRQLYKAELEKLVASICKKYSISERYLFNVLKNRVRIHLQDGLSK